MYTVYTDWTNGPSGRQEYYTHLIDSWAMNGNIQSFRDGAAAFRNLRDWAKEQRDEAIRLTNSVADEVEGERILGEEDAKSDALQSRLRAMNDSIDLNDSQTPPPAKRSSLAKRPSPAAKSDRASKRTKAG
ncbi:MAG: hypothetical protein M1820_004500 [Bogoriella megaspora]|nr:MAG: hypothetical protein M1820_004500 [Bogoriella megaspora]